MSQKEVLVKLAIILLCGSTFLSCSVARNGMELSRLVTNETPKKVVIKGDIDLMGKTITFPEGCSLVFKKGSISNGDLKFASNRIKGNVRFINCNFSGTIDIKRIDDRCFTSSDDDGTLKFLLTNGLLNGSKCDFYRDYHIDMNAAPAGLVSVKSIDSGADITFHDCTIYNTKAFKNRTIRPVLIFTNVKNVTIRNCFFHDTDEHNSHVFAKSAGCCFLRCYGDCESINLLNCSQENGDCFLRSGVYTHNNLLPENTPTVGLSNSIIKVRGLNVGYGLALYCGNNLDIDIDVSSPHRGFYCSGVSNSTINYKGYNPIETKCHILIIDAVYKRFDDNGNSVLDMKGCHDLVIKAEINEALPNESIISFQTYGSDDSNGTDFSFRTEKCYHINIDFSAEIRQIPETGYFFISRFGTGNKEKELSEITECIASGIYIHDVRCLEGRARPYMCYVASGIDAEVFVNNCSVTTYNTEKNYGYDYYIKGNSKGKVHIGNTMMGSVLVRDKQVGEFDVIVEGVPMTRSLNYTNDNSSRRLVRIIQ